MKKILISAALLTALGVAQADRVMCPASLNCASVQGRTSCTNLPPDWEVFSSPQPASTNYMTYRIIAPRYDSNNTIYNNVQCVYNNSLSLDRVQSVALLYPDMSDAWGWVWNDVFKSSAQCTNYAACPLTTVSP